VDRLDGHRPGHAPRHEERADDELPAAAHYQHPARVRRQLDHPGHVLGRLEPRRVHRQARAARLTSQAQKAAAFRALHERAGAFIVPNPWDAGTARLLAALGFEALATTSLGFASRLGRADGTGAVSREEVLAHCREIAGATPLPVTADLENCYAHEPRAAAEMIRLAAEAGVVGGSIEDATGDAAKPIYDFALAVERVQAAAEVARSLPFAFVFTARAENFLHGRPDLDDTIRRLQAFGKAGADVLYAPGLKDLDTIRSVVSSVSKPVNVVIGGLDAGISAAELARVGVKRISIGGALARRALGAMLAAGREMREKGTFTWMADAVPGRELGKLLGG
jgi:2-methylisocitrate lyase-like PEP mutase family enzyme